MGWLVSDVQRGLLGVGGQNGTAVPGPPERVARWLASNVYCGQDTVHPDQSSAPPETLISLPAA
jgi:hypothetical protein